MIEPYEMAQIYWSRVKSHSIKLVTDMVGMVQHHKSKVYWGDVLSYLNIRKNGKAKLN